MNIRDNTKRSNRSFPKNYLCPKMVVLPKDDFCPQGFCNVGRHCLVVTSELGITGLLLAFNR